MINVQKANMVTTQLRTKYERLHEDEHGERRVSEYDRSVTSHASGNWNLIFLMMALATVVVVQSTLLVLATKYSITCRNEQGNFLTLPKKFVTFMQSDNPQNLDTAGNSQDEWEMLDRPYNGFVHLDEPRALGLPPNKNVIPGTHNMYMTTLYHQFHCLRELRQALVGDTRRTVDRHHAEHCFSYLRQAAMCAGDLTLEPPDEHPEPGRSPLRGWNVTHACVDFDHIENWMQQHEPKF